MLSCFIIYPVNKLILLKFEISCILNLLDRPPEIDLSELESLFSTTTASHESGRDKSGARRGASTTKPEIVHLVLDFFFPWYFTVI